MARCPDHPNGWLSRALLMLTAATVANAAGCQPLPASLTTATSETLPAQATTSPTPLPPAPTPSPSVEDPLAPGKIVYTCQLFADSRYNQICLLAPDGGGQRRLTQGDQADHFYPSLSPSGQSVVFSSNLASTYEIYEMGIETGQPTRLTSHGTAVAPSISPDGQLIVYTVIAEDQASIWLMNRDGSAPRPLVDHAWDAVWSPQGAWILHASDRGGEKQLWLVRPDGSDLRQVTELDGVRGRSDWSPTGEWLATYAGEPWSRELYLFNAEGGDLRQLTAGGNNLAPSFSPDGEWLAYTSYLDNYGDEDGCEIYTMEIATTARQRLTNNDYCDWQPRWGP